MWWNAFPAWGTEEWIENLFLPYYMVTLRIMMNKLLLLLTALLLGLLSGLGAQTTTLSQIFNWADAPEVYYQGTTRTEVWTFEAAKVGDVAPSHPVWIHRFPVSGYGDVAVQTSGVAFAPLNKTYAPEDETLGTELRFTTSVVREPGGYFAKITCVPIVRQGTTFQRVERFTLNISHTPAGRAGGSRPAAPRPSPAQLARSRWTATAPSPA